MAARLRVVASTEAEPEAPAKKARRPKKKAAPESARDRRNRLARERRAAKKREAEAAAAQETAKVAEPPAELSLMQAIELGDQLEILKAQRRDAARALPALTGQSLPAMHRQIAQLTDKISALESAKTEGTDIGDAIEAEDEEFDPEAD